MILGDPGPAPIYDLLANRPSPSGLEKVLFIATDQNGGTIYQCQAGAWVKVASGALETGGRELDYAEIGSAFGPIAFTAGQSRDVTGLVINPVIGSRPVVIETFIPIIQHTVSSSQVQIQLWDVTANKRIAQAASQVQANGLSYFVKARPNPAPAAGARQYKVVMETAVAGNLTLFGDTANGFPAHIQATEV